jgi:hypothetical protein
MDALLLISRLLLAAVLVVAAAAKLRDLDGTRAALAGFRVPAALRHPVSLALPLVELTVAALLVPAATARVAAIGAAALLLVFTAGLVSVLARGEQIECNCLGSIGRRPVGPRTVARNLALLALAAVVALGGAGASATAWLGDLTTGEAVGLAIATVLAAFCVLNLAFAWQLMKQNGRLRVELETLRSDRAGGAGEGASIGDPAPGFELPALSGGIISLQHLLGPGRGLTIMFSDPACAACDPLLPALGRAQRDSAVDPVVMIVNGNADAARAKAAEHGIDPVLVQPDFELARAYGVPGIPAIVRVDAGGMIADRGVGAEESARMLAVIDDAPILGAVVAGGPG